MHSGHGGDFTFELRPGVHRITGWTPGLFYSGVMMTNGAHEVIMTPYNLMEPVHHHSFRNVRMNGSIPRNSRVFARSSSDDAPE